jgi:hypothetical protein
MTEESPKAVPAPVEREERLTELTESRKGVFAHAEVGLPPGFDPPSAALAPAPASAEPVAHVQTAVDANVATGQDAPRER